MSIEGDLDSTAWRDWLLSQLPSGINGMSLVRPEGIWHSHSLLGLFSLPIALWDLLANKPAYTFVGFVTTQNLVNEIIPLSIISIDKSPTSSSKLISDELPAPSTEFSSHAASKELILGKDEVAAKTDVSSQRVANSWSIDTVSVQSEERIEALSEVSKIISNLYKAIHSELEARLDLQVKFRGTRDLEIAFMIIKCRLELWASFMGYANVSQASARTNKNMSIMRLVEIILGKMLDAMKELRNLSLSIPESFNTIKAYLFLRRVRDRVAANVDKPRL